LRTLYSPLSELAEREVAEGLRVGLMLEHEVALAEIADWLGISLGEIKGAVKRLASAREWLKRDQDAEHE
jgi:predicted HTH domain antitoxin